MTLTDRELADLARRFSSFLSDEEGQGMAAWVMTRNRLARELYDALGERLGEPMRGVQIGNGNTQTNTFGRQ